MTSMELDSIDWDSAVKSMAELKQQILSFTLKDRITMPRRITDTLLLHQTSVYHIKSLPDLRRAIQEHVHIGTLNAKPTGLSRLNRIYGRVANRLGTSSRAVAEQLIDEGVFTTLSRNGRVGLVSAGLFKQLPELLEAQGIKEYTPEYDEVIDAWALATIR